MVPHNDGSPPPASDREALRALVDRYASAADRRDTAAFADAFTEDGVLSTPRGERRGRGELGEVTRLLARYDETRHAVTDQRIDGADGDRATGSTWCTAEHVTVGDVRVETHVMTIRYDDVYRRVDGAWRIERRVLVLLAEERRQGR